MKGCPTGSSGTHHVNGEQCMGTHCTYTTAQDDAAVRQMMDRLRKISTHQYRLGPGGSAKGLR